LFTLLKDTISEAQPKNLKRLFSSPTKTLIFQWIDSQINENPNPNKWKCNFSSPIKTQIQLLIDLQWKRKSCFSSPTKTETHGWKIDSHKNPNSGFELELNYPNRNFHVQRQSEFVNQSMEAPKCFSILQAIQIICPSFSSSSDSF
jgi:hypothetical protein